MFHPRNRHLDTDAWWQLLVRPPSPVLNSDGSSDAARVATQYVWDLRYIDTPILRDRDTNGDGTMDERLYYTTDANHNVSVRSAKHIFNLAR
jgi:hypothetical protein